MSYWTKSPQSGAEVVIFYSEISLLTRGRLGDSSSVFPVTTARFGFGFCTTVMWACRPQKLHNKELRWDIIRV